MKSYILIYSTCWLGNPEETYTWESVRMSDFERLNKFALSLRRGFKKDNVVLFGMRVVEYEGETAADRLAFYEVLTSGTDEDRMSKLENAYDSFKLVKDYMKKVA